MLEPDSFLQFGCVIVSLVGSHELKDDLRLLDITIPGRSLFGKYQESHAKEMWGGIKSKEVELIKRSTEGITYSHFETV